MSRWLAFCKSEKFALVRSHSGVLLSVPLAFGKLFSPVLTELNLWNNSIGGDGAKAIAEALKVKPVLTKLDLEYNNLGDAGRQAVRDAVKDRSGFELEL